MIPQHDITLQSWRLYRKKKMYKLAGSASDSLTGSKHLVSFGANGYDLQKQHNKQVRDWFQRHHYEV